MKINHAQADADADTSASESGRCDDDVLRKKPDSKTLAIIFSLLEQSSRGIPPIENVLSQP
jgi:hypothetical protein